jgi:osmoprotectant transport system permease protein
VTGTATQGAAPVGTDPGGTVGSAPPIRGRTLLGYLFMPALLAGVLVALFLWVSSHDLESDQVRDRVKVGFILARTWEHIALTAVSTVLVILIAIPLGILLTRPFARPITPGALAVFNVGQGIPTIGLLALLAAATGNIGFRLVVVGLVAYTSLAVLRNTMVGLEQVDESVIEAARGMGMTRRAVLRRIELPLAVPVMMAGVRTALVINVGTATLGTFFGAGGLGDIINAGIVRVDEMVLVTGSVLVAVLALLVDYLAGLAEDFLRPRGL